MSQYIAFNKNCENAIANIFLFPHAGAGASSYAKYGKIFTENKISYNPVQYPMRENRTSEPMPDNIIALAHDFVDEQIEVLKERPFFFYGRCTGALVAYEAAKYLEEKYNVSPIILLTASALSPQNAKLPQLEPGLSELEIGKKFADLHFIERDALNDSLFLDFYMPVLKADYKMQSLYDKKSIDKLSCDIIGIHGQDDKVLSCDEIKEWGKYTGGKFTFLEYRGGHFFETREMMRDLCETILDIYVEKDIKEQWKTILNLTDDEYIWDELNFFEEGGSSLLLSIILKNIQEKYHVSISFKESYANSEFPQFLELLHNKLRGIM